MIINRVWAMPNKYTFKIKPIKELLEREVTEGLWIDPFANENSPAGVRNDLNPDIKNVQFNLDAIDFLNMFASESVDGVLFDPPYSFYELRRCYKNVGRDNYKWGELNNYWARCKDKIGKIVGIGGKTISFGWNSVGMGKKRGFEITEILLVCHGSVRNDTIITVERKMQSMCSPTTDFRGLQKHHIIFRSHCGPDDKQNIVWLCGVCHDEAHGKVACRK